MLGTAAAYIPADLFARTDVYKISIVDGKFDITSNRPPLLPTAKGKGYIVTADIWVKIDDFEFIISKGFLFDGASIPKPFWSVVGSPFEPDLMVAALIHDWLYWTRLISKDKADNYLKIALLADGVGTARANVIYRAVWAFGKPAYKEGPDVPQGSKWHLVNDDIVIN
jgi:hypothetical protein